MSQHRPTLAELRACVQKDRHREIGNWLARHFARPTAVYGCWLAISLGLSAHQVTLAALLANLAAAVMIGTGDPTFFVLGVILAHLAFWLDHVDGQVARWRGTASLDGVYFDYLMHRYARESGPGFRPGVRAGRSLGRHSLDDSWIPDRNGLDVLEPAQRLSLQGFFSAAQEREWPIPGRWWCRRSSQAAHALAETRPRVLTWPAFKACEPHVILLTLTVLARSWRLWSPNAWLWVWRIVLSSAWAMPAPGAGDRPDRSLGRPEQSRSRVFALVPADRFPGNAARRSISNSQRLPLDLEPPSLYHRTEKVTSASTDELKQPDNSRAAPSLVAAFRRSQNKG